MHHIEVGVYYENTGLENAMFKIRKAHLLVIEIVANHMFRIRIAHLLVIEIVAFAPVVSAPRLST